MRRNRRYLGVVLATIALTVGAFGCARNGGTTINPEIVENVGARLPTIASGLEIAAISMGLYQTLVIEAATPDGAGNSLISREIAEEYLAPARTINEIGLQAVNAIEGLDSLTRQDKVGLFGLLDAIVEQIESLQTDENSPIAGTDLAAKLDAVLEGLSISINGLRLLIATA